MKTKILWIALIISLGTMQQINAQNKYSKSQTVYSYCYAYNYDTKIFYVSSIVSAQTNRNGYIDPFPQDLANQWQNKLKKETDQFFSYEKVQMGWGWTDYDDLDNRRTDIIREYKSKGFQVIYIDDFYYFQKPKSE
jgi:hypothetical protein